MTKTILPYSVDALVGGTVRLLFPSIRGPRRHLQQGMIFLNVYHLLGSDSLVCSFGGGVDF